MKGLVGGPLLVGGLGPGPPGPPLNPALLVTSSITRTVDLLQQSLLQPAKFVCGMPISYLIFYSLFSVVTQNVSYLGIGLGHALVHCCLGLNPNHLLGPFYGAIAVPSVTRCRCCRCCCGHRFYIALPQVSLLSHAACFGSSW